MATATHYPVVGGIMHPQPPKEEEENTWTQMLSEVGSKPGANVQGSVIFLGNPNCGKTSLLQRMTKKERLPYSSALEYSFLNIQSDYKDMDGYAYQLGSTIGAATFGPSDYINLPVYLLNGRPEFTPLLKFAFPQQLSKCAIVLMASLLPPEDILPSLEKWYNIIDEKIKETYDEKEIEACKQAQLRFWQEYVEPVDTSMHLEHHSVEIDPTLLPPEPMVLTHNCGASIVVVLSKCDQFNELNDEQLNRIQYHVRNFCINRGAALFYTSDRTDRNTDLLYKYLAHRVYGFSFTTPAYIVERDSVFIPTGWDSSQKLDIIRETLPDLSPPKAPIDDIRTQLKEPAAQEEDEQAFLARLQSLLTEPLTPKREPAKTNLTPQTTGGLPEGTSPIQNFFGNLMNKSGKTSSTSSTPVVDPSAHFQKILNSSKPKKSSSNANFSGDQSPRNLTAHSSAAALSDQDQEMDDAESVKSGVGSASNTEGGESQPTSARDEEA